MFSLTTAISFDNMTLVLFGTRALPVTVGGFLPHTGGDFFCPLSPYRKGVVKVNVVTYEGLFQLLMVLISFAMLILSINNKK